MVETKKPTKPAKSTRPKTTRPAVRKRTATPEALIPRTASEASQNGHPLAQAFGVDVQAAIPTARGMHFSSASAKPGDVAWVGPCEASGTRVVCYYDQAMEPTDCRNVPCVS